MMGEKVLRVQMLGGFGAYYGEAPVNLNKSGSTKSLRLFQMLLLTAKTGISKSELADSLYGWSQGKNSVNRNLNNLIYRLGEWLEGFGIPGGEYAVIRDGICYWNSPVPVEADILSFEECFADAEMSDRRLPAPGEEERVRLYEKANECYFGELLPDSQWDMWFYKKSKELKRKYEKTVRFLEERYRKNSDYKKLLDLYMRAAAIYPFDGWQDRQIQCYLECHRYEEAFSLYNATMEMYAKEEGNPPAAKMWTSFCKANLDVIFQNTEIKKPQEWRTMKRRFMGEDGDIFKAVLGENRGGGAKRRSLLLPVSQLY